MKEKNILYILTTEDAQNIAEETIGRKLTKDELENVRQYFDRKDFSGWFEEMEEIILEATQNKNS